MNARDVGETAFGALMVAGLCAIVAGLYSMAADYERTRRIAHAALVALCEEAPGHQLCAPPQGAHGWCEHDWQELALLYCPER